MIKKDEVSNPNSCLSKAKDDEMVFVLLGRDPAALDTIYTWCYKRVARGKNKWDDPQIKEALQCIEKMREYQSSWKDGIPGIAPETLPQGEAPEIDSLDILLAVAKTQAQGTTRSQEAGTGAPAPAWGPREWRVYGLKSGGVDWEGPDIAPGESFLVRELTEAPTPHGLAPDSEPLKEMMSHMSSVPPPEFDMDTPEGREAWRKAWDESDAPGVEALREDKQEQKSVDRSGDLMEMLERWIDQADSSAETHSTLEYAQGREAYRDALSRAKWLRSLRATFHRVLQRGLSS